MRSNPPPIRAARRSASPPRNGARTSPLPSGGVSTVTSSPRARRRSTWSRTYTPIPSRIGGNGPTTRTRTRLQDLGAALHRDVDHPRVLLAADDVERVPLLLQVIDDLRVARVHPQRHVVPPVHERQALQEEPHAVLAPEHRPPHL